MSGACLLLMRCREPSITLNNSFGCFDISNYFKKPNSTHVSESDESDDDSDDDDEVLDPRACLSRTGFVIFYANCPIVWHSKLQTTISLSTTEAECVALSTAMRDVIYFINLIQEIQDFGIKLPHASKPKVTCRVFEDDVGALELANAHKLRPRTKHFSVQLHHFRQHVLDQKVIKEKICTAHQRADMFAKALSRDVFPHLRSTISGWQTFVRECHEHCP